MEAPRILGVRSFELAPVEIWKSILTSVIDSTLLFSTDPFEATWQSRSNLIEDWICKMYEIEDLRIVYWGRKDTPAMQEFRRRRSTLRLVCKNWKAFMDSPLIENRCVRISVPSAHLQQDTLTLRLARRIEAVELLGDATPDNIIKSVLASKCRFDAEILLDVGGLVTRDILPLYDTSFPYLKALILDLRHTLGHSKLSIPKLNILLTKLPSLTTFALRGGHTTEFEGGLSLNSPSLQSLSIESRLKPLVLELPSWTLPAIRSLDLSFSSGEAYTNFFNQVPRLMWKLRYLRVICGTFMSINHCFLETAAQLVRLEIRFIHLFFLPQKTVLPSLSHLVNTASASLSASYLALREAKAEEDIGIMSLYGRVLEVVSMFPRLQQISDSILWEGQLQGQASVSSGATGRSLATVATVQLSRKLKEMSVRYQDLNGESLAETQARLGVGRAR